MIFQQHGFGIFRRAQSVGDVRYRFSGTVGRVRYRFRAMFPYESGYGFDAGASPATAVTVIGLLEFRNP